MSSSQFRSIFNRNADLIRDPRSLFTKRSDDELCGFSRGKVLVPSWQPFEREALVEELTGRPAAQPKRQLSPAIIDGWALRDLSAVVFGVSEVWLKFHRSADSADGKSECAVQPVHWNRARAC
jgi:hypothetical protein